MLHLSFMGLVQHRVAPTEPVRSLTRYYAELLEEPVSIMEAVTLDARQLERGIAPACYADLVHGGITMSNADLLPSLLFKINQNQLALEAAIMELTLWVEQRGSGEVGGNVRGALETITKNAELINDG